MSTEQNIHALIRPQDLLTKPLLQQSANASSLLAEIAAICELSRILVDEPRASFKRFLDIALQLCNAGTAGLSRLRVNAAGDPIVQWETVSGALAAYEGIETPRNLSPCGLCLDEGTTVLISRPERAFTSLISLQPAIVEDLILPLYDSAKRPLGTLWIAHHDSTSQFGTDDARIMEQLAAQLMLALDVAEKASRYQNLTVLLDSYRSAQQSLSTELAEERSQHERAQKAETEIRQVLAFKDIAIQEAHHRTKNTIQIAASALQLQAHATASAEVRGALLEGCGRLHVLSKVHELLCRSGDGTDEISMPILLGAVGDSLRRAFPQMSTHLGLQVVCDEILLASDRAIPLALLANEALLNAYKHAFPNGAAGQINLQLTREHSDLILQIVDNGVGIRSTYNTTNSGIELMRGLAEQLKGTLSIAKPMYAWGTAVTLMIHCEASATAAETLP
jgi:two-component sensor histidine kinase